MYPTNPYNQYPYNNNTFNNNTIVTQTNKIYVNCYEDVVKYPMGNNCDMMFINKTEPVLYDKVTDAYGGYIIKTYTIMEKAVDNNNVTKDDLQTILDRLAALENAKNTPNVEGVS